MLKAYGRDDVTQKYGKLFKYGISEGVVNRAPVINPIVDPTIAELEVYSLIVTATDPDGTTPTLSVLNAPIGSTFVDNGDGTGTFNWTPMLDQAAVYTPSFVASDGVLTDTVTVTITVTDVPAFQFTVKTDNAGTSNADQFTMPLTGAGINCNVNWGDGSAVEVVTGAVTHTFLGGAGTYTCTVTGTLKGWRFNNGGDKLKLTGISEWGVFDISTTAGFYGCTNLVITATDAPIISTTSFYSLFRNAGSISTIGNSSLWLTSAVTNWQLAFSGANPGVSGAGLDVSGMTNGIDMFSWSGFNQDLSSWNIRNLTNATNMFNGCTFSTDNYDLLLVAWNAKPHREIVLNFHAGTSQYSAGAPETARGELVTDGWAITDGGLVP